MLKFVFEFVRSEDGAMTIEWVALSAGVILLAVGVVKVISPAVEGAAGGIGDNLTVVAAWSGDSGDSGGATAESTPLTCSNGFCTDAGGNIVGFTDGNNFAPSDGNGSFANPVPIADSGYSLSGTTPSGATL